MIKHHFRGLTKSFGSQIDPNKSEELKRTKKDIENNLSKILKLIQNQDQNKLIRDPRNDTEFVGLIQDFYNQYASLYTLYDGIAGEYTKPVPRRARRVTSMSSSSSDSEYFSSEEGDNNYPSATTHEFLHTQAFGEKMSSQMKALMSLSHQKRNLELKVESQALEVKKLSAKNVKLHARVFELQLLVKKSEVAVSILHTKLENSEDQALSEIAELMSRINKLEQEAKSLRSQNGKMEEKIRRSRNEALSLRKDFTEQINVMQQKFDYACSQNKELEAELETEREKVSLQFVRIQNLEVERQCFLAKIKDMEMELESRCNKQNCSEEQLREHEGGGIGTSICDLRLELDTLQEQKNKLELHNEQITKEYSEVIAKLEAQVSDQEKMIKKQEETIDKIHADKQAEIWSKLNQQLAESKMEELAQEFRKKLEDNICELHQRIHMVEQLNNENRDSCKRTMQRYEEERKLLGEKVSNYEVNALNCLELVALKGLELDFASQKIEEHVECVMSHVSKSLQEVQFAKDWIRKRNEEMKQLKENVDHLTVLVGEKEEKELLLIEKVLELEENVMKLEKDLKEKDEELVTLGDLKREAIRQLCSLLEFHRQRYCDLLKDLAPKRS